MVLYPQDKSRMMCNRIGYTFLFIRFAKFLMKNMKQCKLHRNIEFPKSEFSLDNLSYPDNFVTNFFSCKLGQSAITDKTKFFTLHLNYWF